MTNRPYSFQTVGDQAEQGNPAAQLYWMALASLTSANWPTETPQEVHARMVEKVAEVYTGPTDEFGRWMHAAEARPEPISREERDRALAEFVEKGQALPSIWSLVPDIIRSMDIEGNEAIAQRFEELNRNIETRPETVSLVEHWAKPDDAPTVHAVDPADTGLAEELTKAIAHVKKPRPWIEKWAREMAEDVLLGPEPREVITGSGYGKTPIQQALIREALLRGETVIEYGPGGVTEHKPLSFGRDATKAAPCATEWCRRSLGHDGACRIQMEDA